MSRVMDGGRPALLISIGLVAAAIAGCGGDDDSAQQSLEDPQLGDPINLADCRDWKAGTVEERLGTIHGIREFLGTPVPGTGASREALASPPMQAAVLRMSWALAGSAPSFRTTEPAG